VVRPEGPKKYFGHTSTKENSATQTGQIGAIFLTDLFTVCGFILYILPRSEVFAQVFRVYEFCHLPSSSRKVQSFLLALAVCAFIGTFGEIVSQILNAD
jgi:hypothetical protein